MSTNIVSTATRSAFVYMNMNAGKALISEIYYALWEKMYLNNKLTKNDCELMAIRSQDDEVIEQNKIDYISSTLDHRENPTVLVTEDSGLEAILSIWLDRGGIIEIRLINYKLQEREIDLRLEGYDEDTIRHGLKNMLDYITKHYSTKQEEKIKRYIDKKKLQTTLKDSASIITLLAIAKCSDYLYIDAVDSCGNRIDINVTELKYKVKEHIKSKKVVKK